MSNKKHHQKPATDKSEPVEGEIETKAQAADNLSPTQDQASGQEQSEAAGDQPPASPSPNAAEQEVAPPVTSDPLTEDEEDEEPAEADDFEDASYAPARIGPEPIAARLTNAVSGLLTGGKPEAVHALHKVELLIGDLKNALPAAIEASNGIADECLVDDLQDLLAVL